MGSRDYLKLGDFNAICDQCGFKYKGSELRKRWDGYMVCSKCWEPRPWSDFVRGVKDDPSTAYSRPEQPDIFTNDLGYTDSYALNSRVLNSFALG